jgi:signal transduction histidine kinase
MLNLRSLPLHVKKSTNFEMLSDRYCQTLLELEPFCRPSLINPYTKESEIAAVLQRFSKALHTIHRRHHSMVIQLSSAIIEWRECDADAFAAMQAQLNETLDRIFLVRIGVRALISQHLALFEDRADQTADDYRKWAGVIDIECQPSQVVRDAVEDARYLALQHYGDAPQAKIVGSQQSLDCRFPYIPSHLHHIVFELSKNALRAVIDNSQEAYNLGADYPPITIVLSKGDADLTIQVSDIGGGISRTDISRIFDYSFTTARRPSGDIEADIAHAPLAGFGYGLPLSRQYARYLGGDIQVISMDGYGTAAYVYLKHIASDTIESVPTSPDPLTPGLGAQASRLV